MNHKTLITTLLATAIATPVVHLNNPAIACRLVPNLTPTLSTNEDGQITRIDNLVVPGYGAYTVTFHSGSYEDNFDHTFEHRPNVEAPPESTRNKPTFFDDRDGAIAATNAIIAALGNDKTIAESSSIDPSDTFLIPYTEHFFASRLDPFIASATDAIQAPDNDKTHFATHNDPTIPIGTEAQDSETFAHEFSWAKFTPTPTLQTGTSLPQ